MQVEELLDKIDIVDYISQFTDLNERNGEYWGLSPLQEEKTPSFSVRRETGKFFDFSSGIGGSLISFVKHYNHCSGKEAVEILKKYAGYDGEVPARREKMAATLDCKRFMRKKSTRKQSTGTVLPDDYMKRYEKREEKLAVWLDEGISRESLDKFQVYYDAFSDRLVYPIRNLDGKIVNVGGRTLDQQWKEKKLRKYMYFYKWGALETIYGAFENMDSILERKEIILFEGCKSVLLADTWGIHNTGAILTSHLNPSQMKILAKLGCRVVFALDKEINVRKDHNISKLKNYVNTEFLYDKRDLLDEKDSPVDKGKDTFIQLYNERLRYR